MISRSRPRPATARQGGPRVRPPRARLGSATAALELGEPGRHRADFFERLWIAGGGPPPQHLVHEDPHREHVVPRTRGGPGGPGAPPQVVGRAKGPPRCPPPLTRAGPCERTPNPPVGEPRP